MTPLERLCVLAVMPGITPDAGAERSLAYLVPGLVAAGIEFHLALLTERRSLVPSVIDGGGVFHDLSVARTLRARVSGLRSLIRELDPPLVHATLYEAAVPAQLAVIGLRPNVLVTWANTSYTPEHFSGLDASPWKMRLVQAIDASLGRLASTRFHAVTSGVARVNRRNLLVPADRVLVGERGRDPERFEVTPAQVDAVREELAAPEGTRFVLAVGRQDIQKGYVDLLDQFDVLADGRTDVELLIAGREGSATPRVQERLRTMRHADRVRFLGHRDDTAVLMTFADVVVCSSLREGAAGALIEAMACRAPIVSVPLDGLEDVLRDGENSVVVGDRDRLAEGLEHVLADPALAAKISAGGRDTFEQRFTLDRSAQRLAEIYRATAAR